MRHLFLTATLSALLLMGAATAYAAGNVLLPSSNNGSSSGSTSNVNPYMPQSATPDTAPSTSSPSLPAPSAPPTSPTTTLSAPTLPKPATGGYTPIPGGNAAAFQAPTFSTATNILKLPMDGQDPNANNPNLPYLLNIDIAKDSKWASNDIRMIGTDFNYKPEQIAQHCRISASGFMQTSVGMYMFSTGYSLHTSAKFDGLIKNITVMIRAMCDAGVTPPPSNRGPMIQMGNEYVTIVGTATCPPPPPPPPPPAKAPPIHGVLISYAGNNSAKCSYQ